MSNQLQTQFSKVKIRSSSRSVQSVQRIQWPKTLTHSQKKKLTFILFYDLMTDEWCLLLNKCMTQTQVKTQTSTYIYRKCNVKTPVFFVQYVYRGVTPHLYKHIDSYNSERLAAKSLEMEPPNYPVRAACNSTHPQHSLLLGVCMCEQPIKKRWSAIPLICLLQCCPDMSSHAV